jgi:hypothetical protein
MKSKTIKKTLMCELSDKERREYGISLATTLGDMEEIEAQKKREMDHFKDRLAGLQAKADELSRKVRDGKEWRDVECHVYYGMPDPEHKQTVRLDTGATVQTERMTEVDLQLVMPLDETADEGETVYDADDDDTEADGPRIVDADEAPNGWSAEMLEDVLVCTVESAVSRRLEHLENIFCDGTADPFLKFLLADARPSALLKQQAMRAAIRGNDDLRDGLVCEGAKKAMRKLEKSGGVKAMTTAAKELIALLVPKDLAELDLLLEGGCVLPLGVRNLIRKATDKALADAELGESQPEGAEADY